MNLMSDAVQDYSAFCALYGLSTEENIKLENIMESRSEMEGLSN